jgi:hypothetical protein
MQQGAKMACPYLFLLIAWKVFWLPSFSDSLILNILKIMFLSIENYKNKSRHNNNKSNKICRSKNIHTQSTRFSFCVAHNTKYLNISFP